MKKIILTVAAFVALNISFSQAPESFKYQSVVRDGQGAIIASSPIGVQIRILQGGTSGTSVYTEAHTGITNAYGLMNLEIGGGTVGSGNFSTIDWGNGPYYVEISIDETGGTSYALMGASELLSVPYALHAKTVDNVDDADANPANEYNTGAALNGSNLEITDGGGTLSVDLSSLGGGVDPSPTNELNTSFQLIGTTLNITDPGGTLSADLSSLAGGGDPSSTNELNTSVTLVGTTLNITDPGGTISTDLSSLSGGGGNWTTSGNNIYNSNTGNVGVGVTNPTSKFHVVGTASDANPNGVTMAVTNSTGTGNSQGLNVSQTTSNALNAYGIKSDNTVSGATWSYGIQGDAHGSTEMNRGFQGATDGSGTIANMGVAGFSSGTASGTNYGVFGTASGSTTQNSGVAGSTQGTATLNIGTEGSAAGTGGTYNIGIWGDAANGGTNYAGYFDGDVAIIGNLSKGGGTFKIDHPQDPANKYLIHSFVESPDMMNIYNGNITTDANGYATVEMPSYFEAANKEFRYQLTVIGSFAQAIIKEEVNGNKFVIQTSEPNIKVSWMVTGVRADKWADENRVVPEVAKDVPGTYLYPHLYGESKDKSVIYNENNEQLNRTNK